MSSAGRAKKGSGSPVIRWLHLSDLHLGQPGSAIWWQAHQKFQESLRQMLSKVGGPPHLVLITGDLAYSGKAEEYQLVDRFLDELKRWLTADGGTEPLIVFLSGPLERRLDIFRLQQLRTGDRRSHRHLRPAPRRGLRRGDRPPGGCAGPDRPGQRRSLAREAVFRLFPRGGAGPFRPVQTDSRLESPRRSFTRG